MTARLTLRQIERLCELEQAYRTAPKLGCMPTVDDIDNELEDRGLAYVGAWMDRGVVYTEIKEPGLALLDKLATEAGGGSEVKR